MEIPTIADLQVPILLYADDAVLMAKNQDMLQR